MPENVPIPSEIEREDFEGPDKVAKHFNRVMDSKIEKIIEDDSELQQVLYVIDADVSPEDKVSELPPENMFTSFARYLNSRIEKGRMTAGTARNWFTYIKRYYIKNTIDELKSEVDELIKKGRDVIEPRSYSGADDYWNLEEVKRIIRKEKNSKWNRSNTYCAIWLMCFVHGRRVGEVLDVKWSDIGDGKITYNIEKKESETKASLELYDIIKEELDEIEKIEGIEYVFHGFEYSDGEKKPANKPLSQAAVRNRLERLTEYTEGVEKSSHTKRFRHSIATIVTKEHGSKVAQNLLQHANPEITMRVYARHIEEDSPDQVESVWKGEL